ncbi:MAG: GNAT family N-acetyltransferase [Rhodospirillales bacterium]|nr:GNAT family N-acetyltransferase [Rhodospirillales bacterium]
MASRFRRAHPDDAPAIAHAYVEAWRDTYPGLVPDEALLNKSPEIQAVRWARVIDRAIEKKSPEIVVVAEDRTQGVIGVGTCGPNRQRRSGFAGEVYALYIHPDFQEQGNGRGLLLRLFEELSGAGLDSVVVWVLAANPSRYFYEAMGGRREFERVERLWGADLKETGYGWPDLTKAIEALGDSP